MKREELLNVVDAALIAQRPDYARDTAQILLDAWPNDLAALRGMARAIAHERSVEAINLLRRVVAADAQDGDAQALLGRLLLDQGRRKEAEAAMAAALAVRPDDPQAQGELTQWPAWLYPALRARRALEVGDAQTAFQALHVLLDAREGDGMADHPAPWLALLESAWRAARWAELRVIAAQARSRWPGAVLPDLLLGAVLMRDGQHDQGMTLLHDAVARDPAGQVPCRLWGAGHPYRHLWPEPAPVEFPGPLPVEVAAVLGRDRLGAGTAVDAQPEETPEAEPVAEVRPRLRALALQPKGSDAPPRASSRRLLTHRHGAQPSGTAQEPTEAPTPEPSDETPKEATPSEAGRIALEALQSELADIAAHVTGAKSLPANEVAAEVHIILSHYGSLITRFGGEAAAQLDKLLRRLARATEADTGVMSEVIYIDQADSLKGYDLAPVEEVTPEAVAKTLAAIDARLRDDKAIIASVLIVGDDEVIPFHRLPNPVEDSDPHILTDAPYAVVAPEVGDKALVGRRAVGRFPQSDLEELTFAIQNAIRAHKNRPPRTLLARWRALLRRLMGRTPAPAPNLGYTASVWRNAAEEVYSVIGASDSLHASPPITASHWRPDGLGPASYGYFNLHGLENAPCWYGQRDPMESVYPDFPVALRPEDVVNSGRAPRVVFSAACYGAGVVGKSAKESLALRFLECGTLGFVGATAVAYGGVSKSLVGADLLARHFWERLSSGYSQGDALREAKRRFVHEMQYRQGYLDTEDHKTLISFVLYGDPTVYPERGKRKPVSKGRASAVELPEVTLAEPPEPASSNALPNEVVQQVKGLMAPFVPGVHEAEVMVAVAKVAQLRPQRKEGKSRPAPTAILTLRKEHQIDGERCWQQIARVAVTDSGQVVKMTVSK